jgi:hypothetical protein
MPVVTCHTSSTIFVNFVFPRLGKKNFNRMKTHHVDSDDHYKLEGGLQTLGTVTLTGESGFAAVGQEE